jgi:hypothetical protein
VHLQDLLVSRVAHIAQAEKFQAQEVRALFLNGSLVVRVLALGLMQGDISLADVTTIGSAITDGRSRNERCQALRLAKLCWPRLSASGKQQVREAINITGMAEPSNSWRKAQEVLSLP